MFFEEQAKQRIIGGLIEDTIDWKQKSEVLKKFAAKKNSILEILSHDLAGLLANIQGLSSILKNQLKPYGNEELNKTVKMIAETSKRAISLIREFVQQEFLESVQVNLIKKRVDIVKELGEVMDQYQNSQQDIRKTFHFFSSSDSLFIEMDDVKFMQVINNLISNAIKFTSDGGEITVRLEDQKEHILIMVKDNGIGIPSHLQEGLF